VNIYVICRNGNTYLTPLDVHPELLFFTILKGAQCMMGLFPAAQRRVWQLLACAKPCCYTWPEVWF